MKNGIAPIIVNRGNRRSRVRVMGFLVLFLVRTKKYAAGAHRVIKMHNPSSGRAHTSRPDKRNPPAKNQKFSVVRNVIIIRITAVKRNATRTWSLQKFVQSRYDEQETHTIVPKNAYDGF